ncbi:MAG: YmdB family metallophosphoesterase, partial [Verrucomicrobiota bacterium]|nr:YmdB family metallophosphoesterase [Verrucomicrobiota bacterium]
SVLGREIASVVWRFRSGLPTRFPVAKGPVRICGVIVGVDEDSGHAVELKRVDELFSPANQSVELAESEAEMEQGSGADAARPSSGGS